jgi:hypothetical protein
LGENWRVKSSLNGDISPNLVTLIVIKLGAAALKENKNGERNTQGPPSKWILSFGI